MAFGSQITHGQESFKADLMLAMALQGGHTEGGPADT